MAKLKVWKIVVSEINSMAKDYWMVPARNITEAVAKAKRETSQGWQLDSAVLVEGDFIMPTNSK